MNPENALELLGPPIRGKRSISCSPLVRKYAVFRLKQASDQELELYLLQLVQALRYENFESVKNGLHCQLMDFYEQKRGSGEETTFPKGLVKTLSCPDLTQVQVGSQGDEARRYGFLGHPMTALRRVQSSVDLWPSLNRKSPKTSWAAIACGHNCAACVADQKLQYRRHRVRHYSLRRLEAEIQTGCDLSTFLIDRCAKNLRLANYFYWYLSVECESTFNTISVQEMYLIVLKRFLMKMEHGTPEQQRCFDLLRRQSLFVGHLTDLVVSVAVKSNSSAASGAVLPRPKRLRQLKERLVLPKREIGSSFADFDLIPMPLDPDAIVDGILPGKTEIFKSATLPCKFYFRLVNSAQFGREFYKVIFKVGNDLRQDQFAMQIINLFNKLFVESGLDLKVVTYKVQATSANSGFVEFVESQSLSAISSEHGSLRKFFAAVASKKNPIETIEATFSKSCAAYCVMTYVLGVGDRHLDNLLLTPSGCLFHVDFAYLFGRDPKPLPPPMRLTKEMIEAMGGAQSVGYRQFRQYCHSAYLVLRSNSHLILSLLRLMSSSSIPSLMTASPRQLDVTAIVRDRLKLELSEAEAVRHIDHLLHISASAVVASFVERMHKIAQAIRP